jgi:hypothetical protein
MVFALQTIWLSLVLVVSATWTLSLLLRWVAKSSCFPSSDSKRQESMEFGASEYSVFKSGEKLPEGFRPVKHLLLCGSATVDYSA